MTDKEKQYALNFVVLWIVITVLSFMIFSGKCNAGTVETWAKEFNQEEKQQQRDTKNFVMRQQEQRLEQQEFFRQQRQILQSQQQTLKDELQRQHREDSLDRFSAPQEEQ